MAQKVELGFFSPIRNHEAVKLDNPENLNWEDFKKVWLQDYKIYRGVSYNDQVDDDGDAWTKILYSDAYFPLLIGLCQAMHSSDVDEEKLQSNIGVAHYFNPLVWLSLLFISLAIGLKKAADKHEVKHPKLSKTCEVLSYGVFYTLAVPLLIVGFLSEVTFTAFQALLSAIFASCSAPFSYLGKVDKSVFKNVDSTFDEDDNPLLSSSTCSST